MVYMVSTQLRRIVKVFRLFFFFLQFFHLKKNMYLRKKFQKCVLLVQNIIVHFSNLESPQSYLC